MNVPFLDLSRRVASLRPELEQAINGVLDHGPFVLGPVVAEFEQAFAAYCGVTHAVGVASGTDAVTVALQAVGVRAGDEVITTSNAGVPPIAGIEATGAVPVLIDVDMGSMTLDPALLESVIGERTRAILAVHLYGRCADMGAVTAVAQRHGLKVVEDAAQAHGAEYEGQRAGTLGDAAAFSFYPTKNVGALGDGGAVTTNDEVVATAARRLRVYGEDSRYHSVIRGRNSRLDPLQAAMLLVQLAHLDRWNDRRRALAAHYVAELSGTGLILPETLPGAEHAYHLFVVRSASRDRLRAALAATGIESLVHYPTPVHRQLAYAGLAHSGLTHSEQLSTEVLSLPLYPELTDDEAAFVATTVREVA